MVPTWQVDALQQLLQGDSNLPKKTKTKVNVINHSLMTSREQSDNGRVLQLVTLLGKMSEHLLPEMMVTHW